MYTSNTILVFNPICIFNFAFKDTGMSFKFSFCVIKTRIVDLIDYTLIKTRIKICVLTYQHLLFDFLATGFLKCMEDPDDIGPLLENISAVETNAASITALYCC